MMVVDTMTVTTGVLTSAADLEAIEPEWDDLLDDSAQSVFNMRPLWLRAWWRHFAPPGAELRAIACRDAEGTLIGLAPLYVDGAEVRFIGLGGEGPANQTASILARRGAEEPVVGAVVEALREDDSWSRLWLARMRPELKTVRLLGDALPGAVVTPNPELHLWEPARGDYDAYRRTLGHAGRKRIQRYGRRAVERGCVFRRAESGDEVERAFEAYLRWHDHRFDGNGFYDRPPRAAFLREVVTAGFARRSVRVYLAELAGAIVAVEIALLDAGVLTDFQGHADPACASMRLGHVMVAHVLRDSFEDPQVEEVHLGKAAPHKLHWARQTWTSVDLVQSREGLSCTR